MSDRTPGSVRTGARLGDGPASQDADATADQGPTTTQAIPTTGSLRAQSAGGAPATGQVAPAATSHPVDGAPAAGRPGTAQPTAPAQGRGRGRGGKTAGRGPRRAKLQLRHIDTWSAFKISLVLSIALFFIWMVAVGVLYGVLSGLGVFNT